MYYTNTTIINYSTEIIAPYLDIIDELLQSQPKVLLFIRY